MGHKEVMNGKSWDNKGAKESAHAHRHPNCIIEMNQSGRMISVSRVDSDLVLSNGDQAGDQEGGQGSDR